MSISDDMTVAFQNLASFVQKMFGIITDWTQIPQINGYIAKPVKQTCIEWSPSIKQPFLKVTEIASINYWKLNLCLVVTATLSV